MGDGNNSSKGEQIRLVMWYSIFRSTRRRGKFLERWVEEVGALSLRELLSSEDSSNIQCCVSSAGSRCRCVTSQVNEISAAIGYTLGISCPDRSRSARIFRLKSFRFQNFRLKNFQWMHSEIDSHFPSLLGLAGRDLVLLKASFCKILEQ